MKKLSLSFNLEEKIYDLKYFKENKETKITSYFPLTQNEKQTILNQIDSNAVHFKSIFSDSISESDWLCSKEQIKKKFQDELFHLD